MTISDHSLTPISDQWLIMTNVARLPNPQNVLFGYHANSHSFPSLPARAPTPKPASQPDHAPQSHGAFNLGVRNDSFPSHMIPPCNWRSPSSSIRKRASRNETPAPYRQGRRTCSVYCVRISTIVHQETHPSTQLFALLFSRSSCCRSNRRHHKLRRWEH